MLVTDACTHIFTSRAIRRQSSLHLGYWRTFRCIAPACSSRHLLFLPQSCYTVACLNLLFSVQICVPQPVQIYVLTGACLNLSSSVQIYVLTVACRNLLFFVQIYVLTACPNMCSYRSVCATCKLMALVRMIMLALMLTHDYGQFNTNLAVL